MRKRLILNADDFGLTPGINRAVQELYEAGALSSATLMACAPAFDEAVAIALAHPGLGIGCHVVLTDGTPLAPPATIPSLLDPTAPADAPRFRPSLLAFYRDALLGKIHAEEVELEIEAQLRRIQATGLPVTHLDSHKHTHMLPVVLRPLLRIAKRHGVRAVRNPFEGRWVGRASQAGWSRRLQVQLLQVFAPAFFRALRESGLATPDGCAGVTVTGNLQSRTLATLLQGVPAGTWELLCHPGYNDASLSRVATRLREERDHERTALLECVPRWRAAEPEAELVTFHQISQIERNLSEPHT